MTIETKWDFEFCPIEREWIPEFDGDIRRQGAGCWYEVDSMINSTSFGPFHCRKPCEPESRYCKEHLPNKTESRLVVASEDKWHEFRNACFDICKPKILIHLSDTLSGEGDIYEDDGSRLICSTRFPRSDTGRNMNAEDVFTRLQSILSPSKAEIWLQLNDITKAKYTGQSFEELKGLK